MFYHDIVAEIVRKNAALDHFWRAAHGWAPYESAELLSNSRLDRQVSLSRCLAIWEGPHEEGAEEGCLILAWANLGALVEGTLKLFLAVWYDAYMEDDLAPRSKGKVLPPDKLMFRGILDFLGRKELLSAELRTFAEEVQQRRNAIHFFKDRDIGDPDEFYRALLRYRDLIEDVELSLPYPDGFD